MQATDFSSPIHVASLVEQIRAKTTRAWTIMEVCGGQTHAILRYGIDQLLPDSIRIVHGPGCPVCVTPIETIDQAITIASIPGVIFCTFGDMLRVPGSAGDLMQAKSRGADVRIIQSPMEAYRLALAQENQGGSDRQVVLFAIGFETTTPATAMAIRLAKEKKLSSFSALVCHVLVPRRSKRSFQIQTMVSMDSLLQAMSVRSQAIMIMKRSVIGSACRSLSQALNRSIYFEAS